MLRVDVRRQLEQNLTRVRARIAAAARSAGRPAGAVQLVAVTKSVDVQTAAALCGLGQVDLAENRADRLDVKRRALADLGARVRWHFVGHVQTNKAKRVAEGADVVHSVDSAHLCRELERRAAELGRTLEIFLQRKIAPGETRGGAERAEIDELVRIAASSPHLRLCGLMTLGPVPEPGGDGAPSLNVFRALAAEARALEASPDARRAFVDGRVRTSMGMSDDFEIAIAAGSDVVRVGSALFGGLGGEEAAA